MGGVGKETKYQHPRSVKHDERIRYFFKNLKIPLDKYPY